MVSVFSSIYALCYVDCFVDIEPTIHTWDESNSVMVHDLKEFLDSTCKGFFFFLRIVLSARFITEISPWFFFNFLVPFPGFGIVEWIYWHFFSSYFMEWLEEFGSTSSLKVLWNKASAVTLATDINTALDCVKTTNPLMAFTSCNGHGSQHGLRWLHMHSHQDGILRQKNLRTSPRHQTGGSIEGTWSHGSQAPSGSGTAAWTTDSHMTSGGIKDHGGPLRRSNPDGEPFLIMVLHCCPEPGEITWPGIRLWGCVCICIGGRLLYTILPSLLSIIYLLIVVTLAPATPGFKALATLRCLLPLFSDIVLIFKCKLA